MYSLFLIFVWRRKLLLLTCALFFLIGIWVWAILYSNTDASLSDHKISSIEEFDNERKRIVAKYGIALNGLQDPIEDEGVKFVKPTHSPNGFNLNAENNKHDEYFDRFKSFMEKKKTAVDILKDLEVPSRDDIARRRETERLHFAAERQSNYEHELHRMGIPILAGLGSGGPDPPNQRLVHLDLKGAPPKISYLKRILPIIKSLGATGLLIEYEDMFPFSHPIEDISAKNCYKISEILELLHAAAMTGLSVMPLVQTFGHLEFALKLQAFQDLREVPESPQSICPSFNKSIDFLEIMITQMIELHSGNLSNKPESINKSMPATDFLLPNFTHIHIGCDEVYRMGECSRCKNKNRNELFLSHVRTVSSFIQKKWPHLKVVIWDDMLRQMELLDLQNSKIGSLVEPMVWVYTEDIYRFVTTQNWDKYATVFPTVWAASAFKGAHGEALMIPPARRHLENNLKWLAVINAESSRFSNGIKGIALTGWQRYDHFAVLCELFPVGVPSLALSLSSVSKGYFDINVKQNHILSALTCSEPSGSHSGRRPWLNLNNDPELHSFTKCMFPGSQTLRYVLRVFGVHTEVRQYLENVNFKRGWITAYQIKHNFSSPIRIEELISDAIRFDSSLKSLTKNAAESMNDVYDQWTIDEFVEQTIDPLIEELSLLQKHANQLMSVRTWPRRPLRQLTDKSVN